MPLQVSWCLKDGRGDRTIPDGTFNSIHWVETEDYIQITGTGDLTKMNIVAGDEGGELDPHGATNEGNPVGGKVITGKWGAVNEWTNFMSANEWCIKACKNTGDSWLRCQHIYDVMGYVAEHARSG